MKRMSSETRNAWRETVYMLSLDLVAVFQAELGMGEFYNHGICEIAREVIFAASEESKGGGIDTDCMINLFISQASGKYGRATLVNIERWQKRAFYRHSLFSTMWLWGILLMHLRKRWDDEDAHSSLPLGQVENTRFRLRVRKYLNLVQSFRIEVDIVQVTLLSEWDRNISKRSHGWHGDYTVKETFGTLAAREFWHGIGDCLDSAGLEELQQWGREEARSNNMPLRYNRIPRV